ncbi:MAG: hypothetical protein WCB46_05280 [Methanoregula sp.]
MGMKENFTTVEWENLISLPYAVSMTVMMAVPSILGVWGETKATLQEPANLAAASGSALVGLILAEMQSRVKDLMKDQQNSWKNDQAGYRTKTLDACRSAATALAKVPPEEGLAYKKWVLAIGLKVAEAAKENGVAVSDPEKAALSEISTVLGIGGQVQ